MGDARDVEERGVTLAAFDGTNIGTMKPGPIRQLFLGESQRVPAFPNRLANRKKELPAVESGLGITRRCHATNIFLLTTMRLQTISSIQ
jgi:hypothetical protein